MKYPGIIFILFLIPACKAVGQNTSDTLYPYKYTFYVRDGLKYKSDLKISKSRMDTTPAFNIRGISVYSKDILTDTNYSFLKDSICPFVLVYFYNRKIKTGDYTDQNGCLSIHIPAGKYRIIIRRAGLAFADSKIRIRKNRLYTLYITMNKRTTIMDVVYYCKIKKSRKERNAIRDHVQNPRKYKLNNEDCDCINSFMIYD